MIQKQLKFANFNSLSRIQCFFSEYENHEICIFTCKLLIQLHKTRFYIQYKNVHPQAKFMIYENSMSFSVQKFSEYENHDICVFTCKMPISGHKTIFYIQYKNAHPWAEFINQENSMSSKIFGVQKSRNLCFYMQNAHSRA